MFKKKSFSGLFGKKSFKNAVSKEEQQREREEFDKAAKGLSKKFGMSQESLASAYKNNQKELKSSFQEASSASSWGVMSLVGGVAALGSIMYLRQFAILMFGAGVLGFVYNQSRLDGIKKSVNRQLEYHGTPSSSSVPKVSRDRNDTDHPGPL